MITRIFRARINPDHRDEFEAVFPRVSMGAVEGRDGFISAAISKPTEWAPDEYVMVSIWRDEKALKAFAGDKWNEAHIPEGMERFFAECWLHHYESFE